MSPVRAPLDQHPQRPRGFTLIELLVVIFIISVLIGTVLTVVPKVKRAVYAAETQAQLSALSNAIQQYYNDYKSYPGPLPNSQLCAGYDQTANQILPQASAASPIYLSAVNISSNVFPNQAYNPGSVTFHPKAITSSQNLVLGLLGGLEMIQSGSTYQFQYNAQDIFADGATPAPRGPASLNIANPRRQQAYIQVKAGEISNPNTAYYGGAGASFVDSSQDFSATDGRSPQDAMIPVFLDKYSDPMPILYYRTNVGAPAIVGFRNFTSSSESTPLQYTDASGNITYETAQYDLLQNLPYTASMMGTIASKNPLNAGTNATSLHGLQGITGASNSNALLISSSSPPTPPVDTIDTTVNGQSTPTNNGANGLAYFKDPSLNSTTYDGTATAATNVHLGVPRQKDGYVLISAGPDRLYGTHDDLIFPGPLQP